MNELITSICAKKHQFVCRNTGDELILIRLENNVADFNQYLTLNEVGAFIWENLEPTDDETTLIEKICAEFEANETEVREDLLTFLKKLIDHIEAK
ncbi:MAG: hypothetical protein RIS20_1255 [Bacteroidota bacterium]|jgi:GGDEF domain-containing protein